MPERENPEARDLSVLLERAATGDDAERAAFFETAYAELRRIARLQMAAERGDHTLQATALVHEAFLKLMNAGPAMFADRARFFAAAAEAMRRILVDHARGRGRIKRGRGRARVSLEAAELARTQDPAEIVAVDEALRRLQGMDARAAQVAELRLFAGLGDLEIAQVLGLSDRTVRREWTFARAWLQKALIDE